MRAVRTALAWLAAFAVLAGVGSAVYLTRDRWLPWVSRPPAPADGHADHHAHADRVTLTAQARANLKLTTVELTAAPFRPRLQVPGMIVDRPGESDRAVSSPVAGVVREINARPGDTVRASAPLFTLRIYSETVQNAQAELFKASRDLQLNQEQQDRIAPGVKEGVVPEQKLIDLRQSEQRFRAAAQSYRQELSVRGFTPEQIEAAAAGKFVTEITLFAPRVPAGGRPVAEEPTPAGATPPGPPPTPLAYEVQDLKVHLGDQVQAGQPLCLLANHQSLYIEGRGFKQEAAVLQEAAAKGWEVEAAFADDAAGAWPRLGQKLIIRHLANAIDPTSRTFAFFIPLENQSRSYTRDGQTFVAWRFRPGQRVTLKVPFEPEELARLKGKADEEAPVFVLPPAAVVREGPDTFVFRQNGDSFERKPVHVVYEDRDVVALADDGSVGAGQYVVANAAAALNRVLKAARAAGEGGHEGHSHDHSGHSHDH